MEYASKIISFDKASQVFEAERAAGHKLVQCHGTFDLIHPGHIVHFEEAKELGDKLVVTLTAAEFVNKGPGRPYFDDALRSKSLAALECVDYVVLIPYAAAVEAIELVKPRYYCKGKEYADQSNDVTGNIADDVKTVERCGGEIRYVGSVVFSSTKLINNNLEHLSEENKEFCKKLAESYSPDKFRDAVENFKKLKVLVLGDVIFDKYTYVHVQGLTTKNRMLSGRYEEESIQLGGSLAVYRHLSPFCGQVDIASIIGTESWLEPLLHEHEIGKQPNLLRDPSFTTIVKQRFVELSKRSQELGKLFSINYIDSQYQNEQIEAQLIDRLFESIKGYDLVVVTDFGHGLMTDKIRSFIQAEAPFLAVNCQTNSYNHGYNLISQQYQHANAFSLDEAELMLDAGKRALDPAADLERLRSKLGSHMAWLTRGAKTTVGLDSRGNASHCARLEDQIVDTIGAGDAFYSLAALAACQDLPIELGTFLGQLAGAQAVRIIGNTESVSKSKLLKGGMSLLNF
ncbi:PfkB family carbohydrate kinase [Pelagicoccus enzymogenes]|uniref:PfkB family carbohydrate kinase n=1 Tax=Pelagicoccus enzymogenes TaxID=2773457 RepID=UPI00280EA2E7|nr:PfkB family carbohydrate kinase [Pelagicoccus enzymogenes]MDQ8199180.1 PfkB family carbohydrate kinase [Pelagicoccus enzymogenes]